MMGVLSVYVECVKVDDIEMFFEFIFVMWV